MHSSHPDVTELLVDWSNGSEEAVHQLMPLVYSELRRLARDYMRRERAGHTLQATALVNEAYLRLVTLLVIASGVYRLMAKRMRGYADAQARQIFRDLIDTPANVTVADKEIVVSFHRRAHLPIILASGLLDQTVTVPWWNGRALRLTT